MSTRLHMVLDPAVVLSLARRAGAAASGHSAPHAERWVFLDTAAGALLRAGIALLLVRRGRVWVHRLVLAPEALSPWSPAPVEWPAAGGRADLSALPDQGLRRRLSRLAAKHLVAPAGEASVRRTTWTLPDGTCVTSDRVALAGSDGEGLVLAHASVGPGGVAAIRAAAGLVSDAGERLGAVSTELAARAALQGLTASPTEVRYARSVRLSRDQSAETAAVAVLRECIAQVRANVVALRAGAGPEAVHQLRVGLRRLRAALGVFRSAIGSPEAIRLADEARWLAGEVGALRDLDVMLQDVVLPEAAAHPDEPGFARLADALRTRGDRVRTDLRRTLAGDRAQGFLADIVVFTEGSGWTPTGDAQSGPGARLGDSVLVAGIAALDRRWRKVRKMARGFATMETEARHDLRKELKKLRYGAEFLGPLFPQERVAPFVQHLKVLQEVFGTLNDAATAAAQLSGPEAPAAEDPAAARAAGRVIGARITRAEHDWVSAQALWQKLDRTRPFWRDPA